MFQMAPALVTPAAFICRSGPGRAAAVHRAGSAHDYITRQEEYDDPDRDPGDLHGVREHAVVG